MQLNPNEEVKLHIGSEHPVIQVANGLVYISRSPGAQQDGIRLADGNPPLDLRGWGKEIYVYNDSPYQADVRLQGGKMVGVSEGVQDNNGSGGEYNYGGGDGGGDGGGNVSSGPIDPASIAAPNHLGTYWNSLYANSLTLVYIDYNDENGETLPLGDNTTQYSLTNFTTTSGPNITSVSGNSALTYASELQGVELNFDGSGNWEGTFDLVSDDPNHGTYTMTAQAMVHSLDTTMFLPAGPATAELKYSYGGDFTGADGKDHIWITLTANPLDNPPVQTGLYDIQPGSQVFSVDPESWEQTEITGAAVLSSSVYGHVATPYILLQVDVPEGAVPTGHRLQVMTAEFIARDGSARLNPAYADVDYPTGYRTELTVTRTSERDFTFSGSFDGLTLAAPITEAGNGEILIGGSAVYEYGDVIQQSGTTTAPIVLQTDGTWELSVTVKDNVLYRVDSEGDNAVDIGPWSYAPLRFDDGNGNVYDFYWAGNIDTIILAAPDVATWTNQQVTNLAGFPWVQAENTSHPIPSDGSFVMTSFKVDGSTEPATITENYIRTTNQWASIKFSGVVVPQGSTVELTGYWKADNNSWQDSEVTWTMVRA